MKRNYVILTLLILSSKLFGLSFPEYPLVTMIEHSEFIVHGYVIDTFKTDSITKQVIRTEDKENRFCWSGYASKTAKIKVIKVLKGQLQHDTIYIPYHSDLYHALPDFELTDTLVLFLN